MGDGSQIRLPNLKPKASFGGEGVKPNVAAIRDSSKEFSLARRLLGPSGWVDFYDSSYMKP